MISTIKRLLTASRRDGDVLVLPEAARGLTRRQVLAGLALAPAVGLALPRIWVPGERAVSLPAREVAVDVGPLFRLGEEDDVSIDVQYPTKQLYGWEQFPVTVAMGLPRVVLHARVDPALAPAFRPGDLVEIDARTKWFGLVGVRGLFRVELVESYHNVFKATRVHIRAVAVARADGSLVTVHRDCGS